MQCSPHQCCLSVLLQAHKLAQLQLQLCFKPCTNLRPQQHPSFRSVASLVEKSCLLLVPTAPLLLLCLGINARPMHLWNDELPQGSHRDRKTLSPS